MVWGASLVDPVASLCAPENIVSSLSFDQPDPYSITVCAVVRPEQADAGGVFLYYSVLGTDVIAGEVGPSPSTVLTE